MKKKSPICLLMSVLLLFCLLTAQNVSGQAAAETGAQEEEQTAESVVNGCSTLDGQVPVMGTQQLVPNMDAAILYDVNTETLLYALNPDTPMYPASLAKIMTTLIAVEQGNLSDAVTVKERVIATVPNDAVTAYLLPNEILTLEDAIYCMMVGSANDAAAVIADHVSGSQEAFVKEMNRYAENLGCTGTVFTNPHGLHDANQVTTARDMGKILNYALNNPDFVKFFSAIYYTVPATNLSESRYLSSNNYLMNSVDNMRRYNDSRVTGGRAGVAEDGKSCLAASAEDNDRKLISIIMGSASIVNKEDNTIESFGAFSETSELLTLGFDNYEPVQVLHVGQIFRQCTVANGENDVIIGSAASAVSVLPSSVSVSDLNYRYFDEEGAFEAPIEKGQKLSHVQIWYGNVCVAQTDLYAMSSVQTAVVNNAQDLTPEENEQWHSIVITAAAIVVGVIVVLLCIRLVGRLRLAAIRRRGRRYRKSRRRSR